jgi:hypothetical protein
MSRRSRLRTFAARASLTLLVALVVVWAASRWVLIYCPLTPHASTTVMSGLWGLVLENRGKVSPYPFVRVLPLASGGWLFSFYRDSSPGFSMTVIPLWAFAIPLAFTTALLWRSELSARRRARAGLCPTCRYDLSATPTGAPCPECGTPATTAIAAIASPAAGIRENAEHAK